MIGEMIMKKTLIIVLLVLFSVSLMGADKSDDKKFFLSVNVNLLSPADGNYKDIYGSTVVYPGIEIGFRVFNKIYLLAGYEKISNDGKTPILDEIAKSTQNISYFGLRYRGSFSDKFGYLAELGGSSFSYKEEAFGEVVKGSKIGFFLNGGIDYDLGERFFVTFIIGYSSASDNIEGVKIKFGGLKSSLGFGIKF